MNDGHSKKALWIFVLFSTKRKIQWWIIKSFLIVWSSSLFLSNFVWIEPESKKMIHWNFHILVLKCEWNECFWIWFFRFSKIKNMCVFDIWKQRILTKKNFFPTTTNTFISNIAFSIQNECFEYYICSFDVPTTNKRKTFSRITQ